ncbi:MAG: hypothetical protein R3E95_23050 [Thiolinea sp.]
MSCDSQAENHQFLVNAVLLIEVISRSTRKADKEIKRLDYLQLSGLWEYVLIEQDLVEAVEAVSSGSHLIIIWGMKFGWGRWV